MAPGLVRNDRVRRLLGRDRVGVTMDDLPALSHVPDEWTSTIDIARGVTVLREAVLRLDTAL